jgi:hypothetical protein
MNRHCLAFLHPDFEQHTAGRSGHLGVDLVRRDLEQRLVLVDGLAHLLDPADDRPFRDRLPHLGHDDFGGHSAVSLYR